MKKIKIFIGSSVNELSQERKDLVVFLSALNNKYIDRGIYIEPYVCEETSGMMLTGGSQSAHNAYIENEADACIFMFYKKAGEFTAEELEIAKKELDSTKRPDVFVFFKVVDNTPVENEEIQKMVNKVANEYRHYYKTFQSADTIKLELLQYLGTVLGPGAELIIKDGKVWFDGSEVNSKLLSVGNIFAYQNNPDIKRLQKEIDELKNQLSAALAENDLSRMLTISKEMEGKQKLYNSLESDILSMLKKFSESIRKNETATKPRLDALHCLEMGDVEMAKRIMNADGIIASANNTVRMIELNNSVIGKRAEDIIDDALVTIAVLKLDINNPERFQKIEAVYDSIMLLCKEASRFQVLYDYASYLREQCNYVKAVKVAEKLRYYYSDPDMIVGDEKTADLDDLLAMLYNNNHRYEEAEKLYHEALGIRRNLAKKNADAYLPDVAETCNNLANLYSDEHRYEESEQLYHEALDISRTFAKMNLDAYLPDVAETSNNLAVLYYETKRYEEAEQLCHAALDVYRDLAKKNPDAHLLNVAGTSNNLANLYSDEHRYEEAEQLYHEALGIRRNLAKKNANAYLPDVAKSCCNLGVLYCKTKRYVEAEKLYHAALDVYRKLEEKNPDAYLLNVAGTCNNLAVLYHKTKRYEEAEKLYHQALDVYRKLEEKNANAYLPNVAETSNNLGGLYYETKRYEEAEKLCHEALDVYRNLAKKNPDAYLPGVAGTSNNLAILYNETKQFEEAEKLYHEAGDIMLKFSK